MNVDKFLERLYAEGRSNDSIMTCRDSMMLNITPSTGVFLDLLISDSKPTRILELGTSNGYSTIWLARAAKRVGALIDTVDSSVKKVELASKNLTECQLNDIVTMHTADCGDFLKECVSHRYDFVFLDSDRKSYRKWASDLIRVIDFGLMVVDNATTHLHEIIDFKQHLTDDLGFSVVLLPIGNGQLVVNKYS